MHASIGGEDEAHPVRSHRLARARHCVGDAIGVRFREMRRMHEVSRWLYGRSQELAGEDAAMSTPPLRQEATQSGLRSPFSRRKPT